MYSCYLLPWISQLLIIILWLSTSQDKTDYPKSVISFDVDRINLTIS